MHKFNWLTLGFLKSVDLGCALFEHVANWIDMSLTTSKCAQLCQDVMIPIKYLLPINDDRRLYCQLPHSFCNGLNEKVATAFNCHTTFVLFANTSTRRRTTIGWLSFSMKCHPYSPTIHMHRYLSHKFYVLLLYWCTR